MHNLEKKLLELSILDSPLVTLHIDEWFENVTISYQKNDTETIICKFINCCEITFKHERYYDKTYRVDGTPIFKYFIQNVDITEDEEFLTIGLSGWPLDSEIVCREIEISRIKQEQETQVTYVEAHYRIETPISRIQLPPANI